LALIRSGCVAHAISPRRPFWLSGAMAEAAMVILLTRATQILRGLNEQERVEQPHATAAR
jgi:hypothetical protein